MFYHNNIRLLLQESIFKYTLQCYKYYKMNTLQSIYPTQLYSVCLLYTSRVYVSIINHSSTGSHAVISSLLYFPLTQSVSLLMTYYAVSDSPYTSLANIEFIKNKSIQWIYFLPHLYFTPKLPQLFRIAFPHIR